ncbi:hypothetical protein B0H14DRAFT_3100604 [Mycena olivaceomarginata]|nr:hypothetical protein B0H14DRAFT_3100604 [Mycena olivaceomarginata]
MDYVPHADGVSCEVQSDSEDEDVVDVPSDEDSDDDEDPAPQWEEPVPDDPVDGPEPIEEDATGAQNPHITVFGGEAGAPLPRGTEPAYAKYEAHLSEIDDNPWAPFNSQMDWQIARWAKVRGSTSTAFSDLLAISGVTEALGLSYKNSRELNAIIDDQLPEGRPGEAFEVYFSPIIECVRALYGDPEFAQDLIFSPERHYTDLDKTIRLYHDLHTAKWWWMTQKTLERRKPGATIVPVIISTDKTQTTMFRNKAAYPVYMTIGNIPKDIRRKPSRQGYILIGYLPTTRLDHIKVAAARRRALSNLYHACMRKILSPLKDAGLNGIKMASGDGVLRRCHPILAIFAGDYPEQCLVAGIKSGECPTCVVPNEELGNFFEDMFEPRDLDAVLAALAKADGNATEFTRACAAAGVKPIYHPFWEDLPFVNIFLSITPDILHQLYQGVIKHVVNWLKAAFGPAEIDARCRRLPPNHNVRLFLKGTEHGQICRILLGLIVDLHLPERQSTARLIRCVRGALDFLYHSQYPIHSTETVDALTADLRSFHDNKSIFIDLGIRDNFKIPKLHNISHYPLHVQLFGTFDNYNTEHTERLHIDFTKDAYRATNRKDEYLQMTLWLERKEKILRHEKFIRWRCAGSPPPSTTKPTWRPRRFCPTSTPTDDEVPIRYFRDAFARFVVGFQNPDFSKHQSVSVYHKIKFWNEDPLGRENAGDALDVVHVKPGYTNKHGRRIGGRFDTVMANDGTGEHTGIKRYRVGRVRAVFSLSERVLNVVFTGPKPAKHLAYVEWFSKFPNAPDPNHKMYKISRPVECTTSIIPVSNIRRSVHLFPQFGPVAPREWTSENVLDLCTKFYVSPWSDRHAYVTIC